MKRILITGAGGPLGVNVTRSLKQAPENLFLVGTDANRYHSPMALTDRIESVPHASKEAYIQKMSDVIKKHRVDLIFPTHPLEVEVLGKNRNDLDVKFFLPSGEVIEKGNDKYSSYRIWKEKGLSVPETYLVRSRSDLTYAIAHMDEMPVWLRGRGTPGCGVGGRALLCRNEEEAWAWIDYWKGWGHFLVCEYLPGDNLTWASVWKSGELITSQGRQRLEYVLPHVSQSGVTGAPAVSRTIHDEELNRLGEEGVLAIDDNPNGTYFLDFKRDKKGHLKITEINPGRFGTTIHFYTEAGINLPYLYVKLAFGERVEKIPKYNPLKAGLYWIRTLDCGPALVGEEEFNR